MVKSQRTNNDKQNTTGGCHGRDRMVV